MCGGINVTGTVCSEFKNVYTMENTKEEDSYVTCQWTWSQLQM